MTFCFNRTQKTCLLPFLDSNGCKFWLPRSQTSGQDVIVIWSASHFYRSFGTSVSISLLENMKVSLLSLLSLTFKHDTIRPLGSSDSCYCRQLWDLYFFINFDSDSKGEGHYNHVTFTPIAKKFMLYCTLVYMLSMLYVRLKISKGGNTRDLQSRMVPSQNNLVESP